MSLLFISHFVCVRIIYFVFCNSRAVVTWKNKALLTYLLNTVELIVIHNRPCEHSSKLQLSIRFTLSRCLDVRQDWYPMYYPGGMKARVCSVQSIEPHRILASTRDSNQEPPGPQSRVVTTILPLHTIVIILIYTIVLFYTIIFQ